MTSGVISEGNIIVLTDGAAPCVADEDVRLRLLRVGLPLTLLATAGGLAQSLLDLTGEAQAVALLIGGVLLAGTLAAIRSPHDVWRALSRRPWLVLLVAAIQVGAAMPWGLPHGPYFAVTLTSVGLAVGTGRTRVVWVTVLALDAALAADFIAREGLARMAQGGDLISLLGALCSYPGAALFLLCVASRFREFGPYLERRVVRLLATGAVPAVTAGIVDQLSVIPRGRPSRRQPQPLYVRLTPREREAAEGLSRYGTAQEIATAWVVEPETVEDHLASARRKTGARTSTQLAALTAHPNWPRLALREWGANPNDAVRGDASIGCSSLTEWSAALADFVEGFYVLAFRAGIRLVGLAATMSVALLPLRDADFEVSAPAVAAGIVSVAAATALAAHYAPSLYRTLERSEAARILIVLLAAALVSAIHPLRSQLWWPACALLAVLSMFSSRAKALAYCIVALLINLTAQVLAGDLADLPSATVVGLWVGLPFWTLLVGGATQELARSATARCLERSVMTPASARHRASAKAGVPDLRSGPDTSLDLVRRTVDQLAPRDVQICMLLASGLHNYEIARFLSVGEVAVSRRIAKAVALVDARHKYELVRRVVAECAWAQPATRARADECRSARTRAHEPRRHRSETAR